VPGNGFLRPCLRGVSPFAEGIYDEYSFFMVKSNDPMSIIETRLTHDLHRAATTLLVEASLRDSVPVGTLADLR
jgi:hypothetical protein